MQKLSFFQGNIWMMVLNVAFRMGNKGARQSKIFPKSSLHGRFAAIAIYGPAREGFLCFMFSGFPFTSCKLAAL